MFDVTAELGMRRAFRSAATELLRNQDRYVQLGSLVGLETEIAFFHPGRTSAELGQVRDQIKIALGASTELGLHQLEVSRLPVSVLDGFDPLVSQHQTVAGSLVAAARAHGVQLLRAGTNPFWPVLKPARTQTEKYKRVPDFQDRYRRVDVEPALPGVGKIDAAIVSLCQAFQVNIEARSFVHATKLLNYSLMLSPFLLALAGNGRFLVGVDTGWSDVRMHAWEISHDTRTKRQQRQGYAPRVGLPERYFDSVEDYLRRIVRFPFILHREADALQIAIGLAWLDARIKFIASSAVVELRSLPTQPVWEDEVALAAAYLGMLSYCDHHELPLMPIAQVADNRLSAMERGLRGSLYVDGSCLPTPTAVETWLGRAAEGLLLRGLGDAVQWLDRLHNRLCTGNPSEQLASLLGGQQNPTPEKLAAAMEELGMLVR